MTENWKEINKHAGCFISDHGNVSTPYSRDVLGGNLPHEVTPNGRYWCALFRGKSYKNYFIHRLVAEYFLDEPNFINAEVNHVDGNPFNNHVDNLEWCTHEENMYHYNYVTKPRKFKVTIRDD